MEVSGTLVLIPVFVLLLLTACEGLQAKAFVRYTSSLMSWNGGHEVCGLAGQEMAVVDQFSTAYLRKAFANSPKYNTDNVWVGLHDVGIQSSTLGGQGWRWSTCQPLGQWTNWQQGEPKARWNNWCVRLQYQNRLQWYPEQCPSMCHFMCQITKGPCSHFRRLPNECQVPFEEMNVVPKGLLFTDEECRAACLAYTDPLLAFFKEQEACWMYEIGINCSLYLGPEPVFCSAPSPSEETVTEEARKLWIRDCYSVSYNTSTGLTAAHRTDQPVDGCSKTTSSANSTVATAKNLMTTATTETSTTTSIMESTVTAATTEPAKTEVTTETATTTSKTESTTKTATTEPTKTEVTTETSTTGAIQTSTTVVSGSGSAPTTPVSPATARIRCACVFQRPLPVNVTQVTEVTKKLKANLTVATESLSSTRRRKESAPDSRVSAQTYGYLGVVVFVIVFGAVVLQDAVAVMRYGLCPCRGHHVTPKPE